MYGNSYNYPPGNEGSQLGRGTVESNGGSNENYYPATMYGHSMSQNVQGQTYYPQQDMSRRPLQTMQLENSQQNTPRQHQVYYGYAQQYAQPQLYPSQPLERHPSGDFEFERPYGFGRGFSQPRDFPPSSQVSSYRQPGQCQQGLGDVDMRLAGPARPPAPPLLAHPEDPQILGGLGGPMYPSPSADVPVAGAGSGYRGAKRMYCDEPAPPLYSGFKPTCTSTPVTTSSGLSVRDSICTPTSTSYQPSSQVSRQQPPQQQTSHAAATVPIWASPVPKGPVPKVEPITTRGGASDSRVVTAGAKAPSLNPSATPGPSRSTARSTSPTPSESSRPAQPRQQGGAAANIERGVRVITGTVDNILVWGRKLEEEARPHILFEIVGSLDSVVRGQWHSSQLVCLRGLDSAKSAVISAVFWEIDRPLSPPPLGSIVACMCRLGNKRNQVPMQAVPQRRLPRMHILKMRAISPGQVVHYKRLAYVSSHAVTQGALAASTTSPGTTEQVVPSPVPLKQTLISSYSSTRPPRP